MIIKKILSIIFAIVVLTSTVNSISNKNSKDIYVDDSGGKDYLKIQDAIDNASNLDTIFVYNGIYNETLKINKSIKIIGENTTNTIIDGEYNSEVVETTKPYIEFRNFTIRNSNGKPKNSGMKIDSNNTFIKNCIFYNTKSGIYLNSCSNNTIDNCTFQKKW